MKKVLILLVCFSAFISCKKDVKSQNTEENTVADSEERTAKQSDGLTLLQGQFVYHDGAAVLQTRAEIYGVLLTDKLEVLDEKAQVFKKEPTDMVFVEIRGKISTEKHDKILWENKVEVVEILNVQPTQIEDNKTIKLGS
jgi:hypothetical protein